MAVPFVKITQAVRLTNFCGLDLAKATWSISVVKINFGQLVVCEVETRSSTQTVGFLHRLIEMTVTITAMLSLKMLSHYMGRRDVVTFKCSTLEEAHLSRQFSQRERGTSTADFALK